MWIFKISAILYVDTTNSSKHGFLVVHKQGTHPLLVCVHGVSITEAWYAMRPEERLNAYEQHMNKRGFIPVTMMQYDVHPNHFIWTSGRITSQTKIL